MRNNGWIFSFVVVVALSVIGCEKQESAPAAPSTPATPAVPATPATPAEPAPATPSAADTPAATPAIPAPADAAAAPQAAAAAATDAAVGASAEATKLLDQAVAYIKENKLDLAEKAITQLEGMKASLSPALQTRVADARNLLNTAKAAGAVKIPAVPEAPK